MCLEEVEEETWIVFSSYEKLLVSSNIACRGGKGEGGPGHVRMDLFVCDV